MKQSTKGAEIRLHRQCHHYPEQSSQMTVQSELLLWATAKSFSSLLLG